ncbi:MAG: Tn3 family transposase [Burkholderiales bacterium]|nr:Tn3 family transposase [Burkholderiales bacterium]
MSSASESHRLVILTPEEIEDMYGLPRFTEDDRQLYFELSAAETEAVEFRTASVGADLVLELGYFKAKRQFFAFEPETVVDDLRHVLARHFAHRPATSIKPPSRNTRTAIQKTILELVGYRPWDGDARQALENKARRTAMLSTQPLYILREALQHLANERIVAPEYSTLQDMVGRAVTHERNRVAGLLEKAMTPPIEQALDALLQADEQMYRISALKHEPKDFSHKELKCEVERRKYFQPLHEFARSFLVAAGLSAESGKYYASLVKFYTVYKLQRMPKAATRLYLLCFAFQRFRQINDNLIDAFIHLVDQYEKQARQAAEAAMQKALTDAGENLKAAGEVLRLFIDNSIPAKRPFAEVKKKAFALLQPERFAATADYLRDVAFDKAAYEWSQYTALSHAFKCNLRHLFNELDFAGRVEDAPLLEAVGFLQGLLREGKSPRQAEPGKFPQGVIPKSLRRHLFAQADTIKASGKGKVLKARAGGKTLVVDRYEFLVYRLLRNALEAGDVFVRDSNEFRRFEDDLISDTRWAQREAVLQEIGAPLLLAPIEDTLQTLREALETRFAQVNQRITEATNQHIKITGRTDKRRWKLIYPTAEEPVNSPFYGQLPGIGIAELLWFVAGGTGFLGAFTHVLDRYVKHAPDARELLACVVALGTNMGLGKMAEVSGMGFSSLQGTARNYLRLETLRAANDVIANATAALPAFHLYDIRDELHSSSDGQRFETQIDTFNARYAPKYFGLHKGISACTLVANHVPINARIIGTHEHESHYVFDLLYNNTSDIKPVRHSTDTHGTNQVNFWILRVFGYGFAPRYRDLHKKTQTLVGFENPGEYGEMLIKPSRKIYDDLIVKEWPNILRIMASLAQKDVTQATIVRKLSSYLRQNQTKKALWELDNICRTLYVLDFIDDVDLRQAVQKALNRGEAYHRFRRAVAYVNGGKFRVNTEAEQQLWNECSRLIANAIIFYNMTLLSKVHAHKAAASDEEAIEILRGISPVAWQHVNLFGTFEFNDAPTKVDIDALAALFADARYWSQALKDIQEVPLS